MLTKITPLGIAIVIFSLGLPAHAQNGKNPPGVNPTHYQCYTVDAPTTPITLKTLRDQFGISEAVKLGRPMLLCAPTAKNGVAAKDRVTHYFCYQDEDAKPAGKKVAITNQFTGPRGIEIAVGKPAMLCVPSRKRLLR